MVNEAAPWQLTVSELRAALEQADDRAVVVLRVKAGDLDVLESEADGLTVGYNVDVDRSGGAVFVLRINRKPNDA